ncbi:MAG: dephospho-CoA kinase [Chitinophagales bacterium]
MIKVGITGGIGSGKTYVSKMFEALGVPVYYADERAKELMQNNEELRAAIIANFGEEAYAGGSLNREFLAQVVFQNADLLAKLNSLVHPAVAKDTEEWNKLHQDKTYTIKEAALLFETGSNKQLDKTILVHADEEERILRVMQRDHVSKDKVMSRIQHQMKDIEKMQFADFIINNDGKREIEKMVHKIHSYFSYAMV